MAPTNRFSAAWLFLAFFSTVWISLQQTPTSSMTTVVSKSTSISPTITMSNPAAWVDTSAVIPFSVVTNGIIITPAAPDSDPQIYLGASIAASAQVAAQSDCPLPDSPNCVSSIGSALNTDNALTGTGTLQSRLAPLLLVGTALAAMLSVLISSFRLEDPNGQMQLIQIQPAPYSSLASVQNSPSIVFVTASDDPNPVTAAMFAPTTADRSTTPTSVSVLVTGSILFSTATASGDLVTTGEIIFTLPTPAATPIESLFNVSASGSACAPIPTASSSSMANLQKRGELYDWNSVVSDANALWPAVAPGGDLQIIRTVTATQLPPFLSVVHTALQAVINAGEQIASLLLTSAGLTAVAAVLFFIALNYRYCINLDAFTFVIPTEALSTNSQSSMTTRAPCPPPTAAPNCNNCGGNAASSSASALCSGIQTKSFLWQSCPCYDPGAYGYNPFNQQEILQAGAQALSLQTMTGAPDGATTSTITSAQPPSPTIGPLNCKPYLDSYSSCWHDILPSAVAETASRMHVQHSWNQPVTSSMKNISQAFSPGASGRTPVKGVQYFMNIGWVPGCTAYKSQYADYPMRVNGGSGSVSYTTLLTDTYHNCTANNCLGGFVNVGCLRYGFYPSDIYGVFNSPPDFQLYWRANGDICGATGGTGGNRIAD